MIYACDTTLSLIMYLNNQQKTNQDEKSNVFISKLHMKKLYRDTRITWYQTFFLVKKEIL